MSTNRVTIRDIAREAGYSKTTVSFAFNDPSRIGKESRKKILEVAERLGYVPDPVARNLSLRRHGTIGLLLPQAISAAFDNPYLAQIVQGIGAICEQEGHSLTLIPPIRESLLEGIRGAAVDGLITLGLEPGTDTVEFIKRRHLPFVSIDGRVGDSFPVVGIDDRAAAQAIIRHVLELGHRRLAIVSFLSEDVHERSHVGAERLEGYREELERCEVGLADKTPIFHVGTRFDADASLVDFLLSKDRPTAVVAMSDLLALEMMKRFEVYGIAVPGQMTVVGFDDIPQACLVRPKLTTVAQPGFQKGLRAAEALMKLVAKGQPERHVVLDARVITRESSAPPAVASVST